MASRVCDYVWSFLVDVQNDLFPYEDKWGDLMSASTESRKDGFRKVAEHKPNRCQLILMCLAGTDGMTAEEIRDELYSHELIPMRDMNMVRPRLTELKNANKVKEKGRRKSRTGVETTVWVLA